MKNSGRRSYLRDFVPGPSGGYVYAGAHYVPEGLTEGKRLSPFFSSVIVSAVVIAGGCLNAGGLSNTFYVILPYIAEVASVFALLWHYTRLIRYGRKVRAYVFERVSRGIPSACVSLCVFSLAGLAASVVFVALNGFEGGKALCAVYWLCKAAAAAASLFVRAGFVKQSWTKEQ